MKMFFCSSNIAFVVSTQLKIISFQNYKFSYLIQTSSEKACMGIVVNGALPSLDGDPLEITLLVPSCTLV